MSWAEDEGYDGYDLENMSIFASPKEDRQIETWRTKDGRTLKVIEMSNDHLFNAYMQTGAEFLFNEMVYRLFEEKL